MKARVAPLPDNDPPLALDPLLFSSTAAPTPQPETVASSSSGPSVSTAESSAIGSTMASSQAEAFVPTTPQPSVPAARTPDVPTSPLTDPEASIPLTPITNRKPARSAKARGKRPAPPDGEVEGMASVGGRAGRGSKCRR